MIALPLNLIFYIFITIIGITLIVKSDFLGKLVASFLFAFLAIWISSNNLLDVRVWYISMYNSTDGTFTLSNNTTTVATPLSYMLIVLNIGLSLACAVNLFKSFRIKRDNE